MTSWHLATGVAVVVLILFDLQNMLAWWRGRVLVAAGAPDEDYTILIPVYGHRRYFDDRAQLERWKEHIVVLIESTPPEMQAFAAELELEGWRVFTVGIEGVCSPRLIWEALRAGVVRTTYALRMDADTRPIDDISLHVAAMRRDGADLCSVKVYVNDPRTQAQRFQALEYRMSMLSQHFRLLLTSGACYVARTDALRTIMDRHSFWWAGEDVETGRIANALRMRICHLDMRVLTDAPATWRALFKQRRLWWAANFRHTWINLDKNVLHMPDWTFYYAALVWVGVVFKWQSLATFASWQNLVLAFAGMWLAYALISVVANLQVASWRMLVFPPYALFQALLMPIVGCIYFVVLARRIGGLGRYRFGYRRREPVPPHAARTESTVAEPLEGLSG